MIFSKMQSSRILAGIQTRTTRLGKKRWNVGSVHPVQRGRFGPVIAHIRIVGHTWLRLSSLTDLDAQDEGYSGVPALRRHWQSVCGKWEGELEVSDVRFVLCPRPIRPQQTTLFDEQAPL